MRTSIGEFSLTSSMVSAGVLWQTWLMNPRFLYQIRIICTTRLQKRVLALCLSLIRFRNHPDISHIRVTIAPPDPLPRKTDGSMPLVVVRGP